MPRYDHSEDGVFLDVASFFILKTILRFRKEHADKIIPGAGDVKQFPSIEPHTNCQNAETYVDGWIF